MRLPFSKRDRLIVGVGTLLVVLLILYAQFFLLMPAKTDLAAKQQELKNEQNLLDIESKKKTETQTVSAEDTKELQMKVPVKPLEDQLILDLEKAETISNSMIKSMSFSQDADVSAASTQAPAGNANSGQNTAANQNTSNTSTSNQSDTNSNSTNSNISNQATTNQTTTNQLPAAAPPTGMKKLTVSLSVESPSYDELEKFIGILESLKRIVVVETIGYTSSPEITSIEQDKQPLLYTLTISAFYMPSLTDLQAQLPKIDAPAPANKDNPLSTFANITK